MRRPASLLLPALALVLLGLLASCRTTRVTSPATGGQRPNVIVILTDDQGTLDVGAYGASDLHTPAMDRLAASGVRFTQFYAGAPVCSPSRAALLTGKSPQAAGVPGNVAPSVNSPTGLPSKEVTLAEHFRDAGYRTALVGKWHLGHAPEKLPSAQGFEHWFGHLVGCIDNRSHFFYWNGPNRHDLWRNGERIQRDGEYFPDLMFEEARDFLQADDGRPFFLYFAANAPHYPYQGDQEWLDHYREEGVPYPRDLYAGFLSSLDARLGALLDELDRLGQTENTIVVFQSDHGHSTEVRAHNGGGFAGPYRGAKFSLFEGGVRVPAMISWPGKLPAGQVRGAMASSMDWLPTLLELCDLPPAADIDGVSLAALLRDADTPAPERPLHWQTGERWAVREGNWKLLHRPRDTSIPRSEPQLDVESFLVDLTQDPGERTNIAADHPDVVARLRSRHEAWVARGHRRE